MEFKNTVVNNFEGAFRGLRNPLNSWRKSDSAFGISTVDCDMDYKIAAEYNDVNEQYDFEKEYDKYSENLEQYALWLRENGILKYSVNNGCFEYVFLGPRDLDLAQRMIKAGPSDSKFLRQIEVCVDITAPLYWWKEFDTYKVGTVANSTSTMHKLASTSITLSNFERDDYNRSLIISEEENADGETFNIFVDDMVKELIDYLEKIRLKYLETGDKKYWKELIRWLPNGWLQTRTVTLNYAVLRNQYFQRRYHKLSEWHQYCDWIKTLPYASELIIYE